MFYLPRICEHCLNPSCVASCPSGAMYKREEDGIVLVDQDKCRGWRMCVSGCPYKKVYFNHRTGKAEKCTFCFPRIEAGQPTICSETCVGPAALPRPDPLRRRQGPRRRRHPGRAGPLPGAAVGVPRPRRPAGAGRGGRAGHPRATGSRPRAARRSTSSRCGTGWRCRCTRSTAPCRWSGTSRRCRRWRTSCTPTATTTMTPTRCSPTIDALRIPIEYLASLFTAGDAGPVRLVLRKLAAVRAIQRAGQLGLVPRRGPDRIGGRQPGRSGRPVPAARDRQVRRALRHPAGARRGRRAADGPARAAVLQPGHRRRARHGRHHGPPWRRDGRSELAADGRTATAGCLGRERRDDQATYKLASVLLQYPTARAVRRPRTNSTRTPRTTAPRPARRAVRAVPDLAAGHSRRPTSRQHYVRDVRPAPAVRAVPDLLPLRRHPQARPGHAGLQDRLPGRRVRPAARQELPDYLPMVLDFAALHPPRAAAAARAPGRPGAAAPRPGRGRDPRTQRRRRRRLRAAAQARPPRDSARC